MVGMEGSHFHGVLPRFEDGFSSFEVRPSASNL